MPFTHENQFEEALANHLLSHGWNEVLMNPTEEDLINNWASIIYDNNREQSRLGSHPLTPSEMQQIITKVNLCGSPYETNNLINGKVVSIRRDNPADTRILNLTATARTPELAMKIANTLAKVAVAPFYLKAATQLVTVDAQRGRQLADLRIRVLKEVAVGLETLFRRVLDGFL